MTERSDSARLAAAKAAELTAKLLQKGVALKREVLLPKQDLTTVKEDRPAVPQVKNAKSAVTRIRTWVIAATTQGPNH